MNVFIVGLPLKISVGIIAMILALPMYLIALDVIFSRTYENIYVILKGMRWSWHEFTNVCSRKKRKKQPREETKRLGNEAKYFPAKN